MTYYAHQLIVKTFPTGKKSKIILEITTVGIDGKNHQHYFGEITIGTSVNLIFNKEELREDDFL